jgi:hypothetical protein
MHNLQALNNSLNAISQTTKVDVNNSSLQEAVKAAQEL